MGDSPKLIEDLVTTIIPVYNRPELLRQAVASVLGQTYRPIEIVIIDDGSTDETLQVARALCEEFPNLISVLRQANLGPGTAREAGRQAAKGEFIQYLDSDDLLYPEKFAIQVAGLRANPDCGVSYGWTRFRRADGQIEDQPWKGSGRRVEAMFPSFLLSRWWDTPTPLYRASVCHAAGPWSDLRAEEDWEYDCRIASLGTKLHYCAQYVVEVRDFRGTKFAQDEFRIAAGYAHRARAHRLIFEAARRACIEIATPEMLHFARELFLLSRQCGAAGLSKESQDLFFLAKAAAGPIRAKRWDFKVYELLAKIIGWSLIGKFACASDRIRN